MTIDEARALGVGGKVIDWPTLGYAGPFGEGTITAIGAGPKGWVQVRVNFPDTEPDGFEGWFDPADLLEARP